MQISSLTSISPIDGRYANQLNCLRGVFSEFGYLKYRVQVEICWLKKLASCSNIQEIGPFTKSMNDTLDMLIDNFDLQDAKQIKSIECSINHDLKAVEYFLKEKLSQTSDFKNFVEFVHFACTSDDINNLAYALMLRHAREVIILPVWRKIVNVMKILSLRYKDVPFLSRTHGQCATPSTFGKEIINVFYRLIRQYHQLNQVEILGKFNGAVGNYNAHLAAYPEVNWHKLSEEFVTSFDLVWNPYTTQIEPHDYIVEFFSCIARFNTILIDFDRDMWGYIALGCFKQCNVSNEIGSSIMPYKINPIYFENSEGNLGLANAIINHFSVKLPISRWQRDLSDSTVLRNLGVAIGYSLIAYNATFQGINTLEINIEHVLRELDQNWMVISEAIQTVMRRYGIKEPYEKLKRFTRGKCISSMDIRLFIDSLPLPSVEKERLKNISPDQYTGFAVNLVDECSVLF